MHLFNNSPLTSTYTQIPPPNIFADKMSRKIRDQAQDATSSESEDHFSESEAEDGPTSDHSVAFDDQDSDEEELERLVLGNKAGFRANLFQNGDDSDGDDEAFKGLRIDDDGEGAAAGQTSLADLDDSALFMLDTGSGTKKDLATVTHTADTEETTGPKPAWEDSDDERLTVSLAGVKQLRKLRETEADDLVSGAEYTRRLRQQYLRLNPLPAWAREASTTERKTKRRRRSSAASDASSDADTSGSEVDDDEDLSALPLEKFLRDASALAGDGNRRKKRKLRPEVLDIQRTRDIPDTHRGPVESLTFHPHHPVLLSASTASIMHLHHINPSAHPTPNPSLASVQVKSVPVRRAAFVPGAADNTDAILFAGRRRFFHTWNLGSGVVRKVTKIQGHQQEQRTMERFRVAPDGRHVAFVATSRKGGGMLNIVRVASMQWVAQARLDARGGIADFAWWRNGQGITILGRDGAVAEWTLETRRTVGIWRDEGSVGGTVLALGGKGGPDGIGGDRWVSVGSNSGVLNVYDRNELLVPVKAGDEAIEIKTLPEPTRRFEQLTTPITSTTFSPDGQLLAFASQHKKDALKLVHVGTCTVYRNWPTESTPLGRVSAVALGRGREGEMVLAVGNDGGKVRLWEIRG